MFTCDCACCAIDVRLRLGVGQASVLQWDEEGVVRRAGTYTFEDIHKAIFKGYKPKKHTIEEMKEGIAQYIGDQHACGRY